MYARLDHTAIVVSDLAASLRFYQEGLQLQIASDQYPGANWKQLVGVDASRLHCVLLMNPEDITVPLLELIEIEDGGDRSETPIHSPPYRGLWLISFRCELEETCERLRKLGYAPEVIVPTQSDKSVHVKAAFLKGPDGEIVELISVDSRCTSVRLAERGSPGRV